jgi:glycerol-3-phosphate acyltransferase PlsY
MTTLLFLLTLLVAYFLGSIPTAFLVGRVRGVDIRKEGSGNSGTTNALRVLGRGPAAFVLSMDAAKGVLSVLAVPPLVLWVASRVAARIAGEAALSPGQLTVALLILDTVSLADLTRIAAGSSCILGHVFPLWLRFRGGKGVATGAAVVFALAPKAALVCLAVFILVAFLGRYVSLASISAALLLPMAYAVLYRGESFSLPLMGFCASAGILVIAMHRKNIGRLLAGTEPRITP